MHNIIMQLVQKNRFHLCLDQEDYYLVGSRFLRYLDTKSNGEYLRKCILNWGWAKGGGWGEREIIFAYKRLIAAVESSENILPKVQNPLALLRLLNHFQYKLLSGTKTSKIECTIIHAFFFTRPSVSTEQGKRSPNRYLNLSPFLRKIVIPEQLGRGSLGSMTMTVAGARENSRRTVVQLNGIHALTARDMELCQDCRKPNRVKTSVSQGEECWIYMAKIQEVSPEESSYTGQPLDSTKLMKMIVCNIFPYGEAQVTSLGKVKECECLAQKLSKQTESVDNKVHNKLLKSFSELEKHSISLELSLQHCKEQMKNNPVCKENASNVFRKEREQYHEIQDLKAQMQDKNMVINELKKLILVTKGKSVETQFDKPSIVRQPNAQRIPKPSVLRKPTPFSNSPEMRNFQTK
ncbi:hypothetical protein Tco_0982466 [Tanacetum coccineum]